MAGYVKADGLTQVSEMFAKLDSGAAEVAAAALYKGAGVVADAFTQAVNDIRTQRFFYAQRGRTRLASPEEKEALNGKTGIARFRGSGGEIDTLVGLQNAGYATVNGKRKPVAVIARSINSGTSFMQKQPVFRRAATKAKGAATQAIVQEADRQIKERTK